MRPHASVAFALLIALAASPAHGGTDELSDKVRALRADLSRLRAQMGRPATPLAGIEVDQVSTRHLLFQASTVAEKADQLAFE